MLCFALSNSNTLHVRKLQLSERSLLSWIFNWVSLGSYVLGVLASHWKGENLDVLRQKWRVKRPAVIAGIKPRIPGLFGVYC